MMKITQGHIALWLMKKGPNFLRDSLVTANQLIFDIDKIIPHIDNQQIEERKRSRAWKNYSPTKEHETSNALSLLRVYRRQGKNIYNVMRLLSVDPTVHGKRQKIYTRWWRKIWRLRHEKILKQA